MMGERKSLSGLGRILAGVGLAAGLVVVGGCQFIPTIHNGKLTTVEKACMEDAFTWLGDYDIKEKTLIIYNEKIECKELGNGKYQLRKKYGEDYVKKTVRAKKIEKII